MASSFATAILPLSSSSSTYLTMNSAPMVAPLPSPTKRTSAHANLITCSNLADNIYSSSIGLLQAAKYTVDTHVRNGMKIGLGSGRASHLAIEYLGRQLRLGAVKDIVGIPTSVSSASEAAKAGIPLENYTENLQIDVAFSDVDAIEENTLAAVIGRRKLQGDESIIQEKAILKTAETLLFILTERQYNACLDGSIPVLIRSLNWMEVAEEIDDLFLGDAEVWRRPSVGHADPLGGDFPLMTREGHNVLDVIFTSPIVNLAEVADSLDKIDGVVDHGVISNTPCKAVIAAESGLLIVESMIQTEKSNV